MEFIPGQNVTWFYTPRGGYGYTIPVPARVIRVTKSRVIIEALKKDGSWVQRTVKLERLEPK